MSPETLRTVKKHYWLAFTLASALMVGATGFEPVTPSVSANNGEALC